MNRQAGTDSKLPGHDDARRITLLYLLLGSAWILLSDKVIHSWITSPALIEIASLVKGWLYMLVTTLLLNVLIHRLLARTQETLEQKQQALRQADARRLQEQERQRAQLEAMVEHRTAELREAKAAAEAASVAKSAYLASLSHEVRNPLSAMIGTARLMRLAGLDAQQSKRLGRLETAAEHLLAVLDQVLDLSRIEAGKLALEEKPVQPDRIVGEVMAMVEDRARGKRLELCCEIETLPGDLMGDDTRLRQALLNYAGNAVKFTGSGQITLRARLLEQDDSAAKLLFEVEDSGSGIEAADLERLFTEFEQAGDSLQRRAGCGLGLAITRRLARLMGGDAGAQSQAGKGSRFWFTARLKKQKQNQPAATISA